MLIKKSLRNLDLTTLGEFDVIHVDPPWKEYQKRAEYLQIAKRTEKMVAWSLQDILNLKLNQLIHEKSFIFLWVGSEHLDDGRALFKSWGLKRCEDIVWIKSNLNINKKNYGMANSYSTLLRFKEHCLVGISEKSNNKNDPDFLHPNIDSDVILTEEE